MNKIYLDKLCNFSLTTYKNYEFVNKNVAFDDCVNGIKQNQSLNEKGIFLKHNFIELKTLIPDIEYDQLVLVNPLCFNLSGNIQWLNFLNSMLTVLNDNYPHETNLIKKTILETADKTFKKKIVIMDKFNDDIITQVCELTNITLFILTTQQEIKFFNYSNIKNVKKILVMINDNEEYFSVLNWNQKYYNLGSEFINYLINTKIFNKNNVDDENNKNNKNNEFVSVVGKKKKKISINNDIINNDNTNEKKNIIMKSTKSTKFNNNIFDFDDDNVDDDNVDDDNVDDDNVNDDDVDDDKSNNKINKGTYKELQADENYALYISEVVDNVEKIVNKNMTNKRKKKNDKNIFVVNKDDDKKIKMEMENNNKNDKNNDKETSIFNKTEKITQKEVNEIYTSVKLSMGLDTIQAHALKLGISIFEGSTKSGKPKNKTKMELIEQIKEYAKNFK